jgi:hypothetical protein
MHSWKSQHHSVKRAKKSYEDGVVMATWGLIL